MADLIDGAGWFFWPLLVLSLLAGFIIVERLVALRTSRVIPRYLVESIIAGKPDYRADDPSVGTRILAFLLRTGPDADRLRAFAQLEVIRMERGLFVLDIVVSAAPLLGLLGTVTGLVEVFANISPETGLPDPAGFVEGVALALTTTMLGLSIAIPALVGSSYLSRRVETLAGQISVGVERLIDLKRAGQLPQVEEDAQGGSRLVYKEGAH